MLIAETSEKVVVFQLGQEEYALPVGQVHSIEKLTDITEIPHMPAFVKGMINLRETVMPIVDLRQLFYGTPERPDENGQQIIVVSVEGKQIGLIVDQARDVIDLPDEAWDTLRVPSGEGEKELAVARWKGRLIIQVNMDDLFEEWMPD